MGAAGAGGLIADVLGRLHAEILPVAEGRVADYIPELGKADPTWFGFAMATTEGQVYGVGDADLPFTIQSVSKPFLYGYALHAHGQAAVLRAVGVEPTGEAFNSIVLDEKNNRPFNPMVNAGAIAVSGLVTGADAAARRAAMLEMFGAFAGRPLAIDEAVYRSELATGHRNRAIAYLMLNSGMISGDAEAILDLYFRQCSVLVTARDLAVMAATLANDGVNPVTGARVLGSEHVRDVLSVMTTCGMYDYAGQWAFEVGMPAKSGVSGAVIAVVPGQVGLCAFSPPLDAVGNSVRGVRLFQRMSREFGLHTHGSRPNEVAVIRRAIRGDAVHSKRVRTPREAGTLEREGHRIAELELQGALFFGTAERVIRAVSDLPAEVDVVILDFRRVRSADPAAVRLLRHLCEAAARQGRRIAVTDLAREGPLAELRAAMEAEAAAGRIALHDTTDQALEVGEDELLRGEPDTFDRSKLSLGQLDLFRGLDRDDCRRLEEIAQAMRFDAGEAIFREGDAAHLLFIVASGSVTVSLALEDGRRRRLACFGPGMSFGEMALLDGGRRSADVTADEAVVCYGFAVERLRELGAERPTVLITILGNLARDISDRLRRANLELRALE
jgi:glutaminase